MEGAPSSVSRSSEVRGRDREVRKRPVPLPRREDFVPRTGGTSSMSEKVDLESSKTSSEALSSDGVGIFWIERRPLALRFAGGEVTSASSGYTAEMSRFEEAVRPPRRAGFGGAGMISSGGFGGMAELRTVVLLARPPLAGLRPRREGAGTGSSGSGSAGSDSSSSSLVSGISMMGGGAAARPLALVRGLGMTSGSDSSMSGNSSTGAAETVRVALVLARFLFGRIKGLSCLAGTSCSEGSSSITSIFSGTVLCRVRRVVFVVVAVGTSSSSSTSWTLNGRPRFFLGASSCSSTGSGTGVGSTSSTL